jgi:hypothetical protein
MCGEDVSRRFFNILCKYIPEWGEGGRGERGRGGAAIVKEITQETSFRPDFCSKESEFFYQEGEGCKVAKRMKTLLIVVFAK